MKKIISLLLVLLMVFSMVACGSDAAKDNAPADKPAADKPAADDKADAPAADDAADAAGFVGVQGEGWATVEASDDPYITASSISLAMAQAEGKSTVGWSTDEVDHHARDTYDIAYLYSATMVIHTTLSAAIESYWVDRLNITYETYDCNSSIDNMFNAIETYATQGIDGLMVDPDPQVGERAVELLAELEMPWMPMWNPVTTSDATQRIYPGVSLDSAYCGEMEAKWLIENYKTFWGDIDTSKMAMICTYAAVNSNFIENMQGAKDEFARVFPNNKFFDADTIAEANPFSAEAGYNVCGAIIAANADIEYWLIATCLEDHGQGAARLAEANHIDDKVLICTNGANILIPAWKDGSESGTCWKAGLHYSQTMMAEPILCGLVALIDGRATSDTLFVEWIKDGHIGAEVRAEWRIVDETNYQDYLDYIDEYLAGHLA